jgi:hypothetical protein
MTARPLNFGSGMPNVSGALNGWMKSITLQKRTQVIDTYGDVTYTNVDFSFMGTIQPLSPKQIEQKPEGQRAWTWLQIHMQTPGYRLNVNDQIIINGEIYKVMALRDYSQSGYIEYHAVKDYQP